MEWSRFDVFNFDTIKTILPTPILLALHNALRTIGAPDARTGLSNLDIPATLFPDSPDVGHCPVRYPTHNINLELNDT